PSAAQQHTASRHALEFNAKYSVTEILFRRQANSQTNSMATGVVAHVVNATSSPAAACVGLGQSGPSEFLAMIHTISATCCVPRYATATTTPSPSVAQNPQGQDWVRPLSARSGAA